MDLFFTRHRGCFFFFLPVEYLLSHNWLNHQETRVGIRPCVSLWFFSFRWNLWSGHSDQKALEKPRWVTFSPWKWWMSDWMKVRVTNVVFSLTAESCPTQKKCPHDQFSFYIQSGAANAVPPKICIQNKL